MLPTVFPLVGRTRVRDTYNAPRGGGTRVHQGVDLPLLDRAVARDVVYPVRSPVAGTVLRVSREGPTGHPNEGNAYFIKDADGWVHLLAHLLEPPPDAMVRQPVRAGQLLGIASNSGNARNTGPHLHYHIVDANGRRVNPTSRLALLHAAMEQQAMENRSARRVPLRGGPEHRRLTESLNGVGNAAAALWEMDRHGGAMPSHGRRHEERSGPHPRHAHERALHDREEEAERKAAGAHRERMVNRYRAQRAREVDGVGDEAEEALLDRMSEDAGPQRTTRVVPQSGPSAPVQSRPVTEAAIEQARIAVRAGRGLVEREVNEALAPSMWDLLAAGMSPERFAMALRSRDTMRPIIAAHLGASRMYAQQAEAGQRGKWVASFEQLLAAHTLVGTVATSFEIARGESVALRPVLEAVRFADEWADGALETGEGLRAAIQEGYDDIVEAAPVIGGGLVLVALGLGAWWVWSQNRARGR